jgi:hypothetical protein
MRTRSGFLLLGILLFFTVLGLSGSVAVLERDTRLKRFSEEDLKLNLDALRRGIDLYRYKYEQTTNNPAKIAALNAAMASATTLADLLAAESFIRARLATGTLRWRLISNLVKNPSFEIDDGTDYGEIAGWRGNFTADDGVPDGWKLTSMGAEQVLSLTGPATYVVSFWARGNTATAKGLVRVWAGGGLPACERTADQGEWKRYFSSFQLTVPGTVRIELEQNGGASGDITYVDGLMIEKWDPPAGVPAGTVPVPSAWTSTVNVVPDNAVDILQERLFREMLPPGTGASFSWWFTW